jgi:hypothetical protein
MQRTGLLRGNTEICIENKRELYTVSTFCTNEEENQEIERN